MQLTCRSRAVGQSSVGAGEGRERGVIHVFHFSLGFCFIPFISSPMCIWKQATITKNKVLEYKNSDGSSPSITSILFDLKQVTLCDNTYVYVSSKMCILIVRPKGMGV